MAHDYGDSVAQELLYRQSKRDGGSEQIQAKLKSVCFLIGGLFADCHRPLFTQKILKSPLGFLLAKFLSKNSLHASFAKIFGKHSPPQAEHIDTLWALLQHNEGQLVLPAILHYIDERKYWADRWLSAMINTPVPLYFINGIHDPISGQHMVNRYMEIIPR